MEWQQQKLESPMPGFVKVHCTALVDSMANAASNIMASWLEDAVLCNTAANTGKMHPLLPKKKKYSREAVIANFESLVPVIREVGSRVHIGFVREVVMEFLWKTRPRGKPEATCDLNAVCSPVI